jgi:DNA primase
MSSEIQTSARTSKIQTHGTENLPCGDLSGDEIIIVEGRADVVNMLKNGVKNVIAMNGMKLPDSVSELSKEKTTTLFVDGDRGGNLIIKNVTENADIDFITMAPEGKEVEELTSKEILQALRKKVKASEYSNTARKKGVRKYASSDVPSEEGKDAKEKEPVIKKPRKIKKITAKEKEKIQDELEKIPNSKNAVVFDDKLEKIKKGLVRRLSSLRLDEAPYIIAIDGTATPRIVEKCEELGCSNLIATNFVDVDTDINLVSF